MKSLFSLLSIALLGAGVSYGQQRGPKLRKGWGLTHGPDTKRKRKGEGWQARQQRRNEAARNRARTPLYPPLSGNRSMTFSSAVPGQWGPKFVGILSKLDAAA